MHILYGKDAHGGWWEYITQQRGMSCGPACAAMVVSAYTGKKMGEEWLRGVSQKFPGSYAEAGGTQMANLVQILRDQKVGTASACQFGNSLTLRERLAWSTKTRPSIAHIVWSSGGGHFVVVPKVYAGGNTVVLDPWYGVHEADMVPKYTPPGGTGRFSGWVITTC